MTEPGQLEHQESGPLWSLEHRQGRLSWLGHCSSISRAWHGSGLSGIGCGTMLSGDGHGFSLHLLQWELVQSFSERIGGFTLSMSPHLHQKVLNLLHFLGTPR